MRSSPNILSDALDRARCAIGYAQRLKSPALRSFIAQRPVD
jgi:hypothetical protein